MQHIGPTLQPHIGTSLPARARLDPPLRVLVVGVSWPLETFVERLLIGLAGCGVDLTLAPLSSFSTPPRAWTDRHQIRWVHDAVRRTPRSVVRSISTGTRGSFGQMLKSGRLMRSNEMCTSDLLSKPWDVVYAPWLNVLIDHPDLLKPGVPLITSCRGTLVTIAPLDPSRTGYRDALSEVFAHVKVAHCVSCAIAEDSVRLGLEANRARVIRPAVNPDDFTTRSDDSDGGALRVVGVGSLNWIKNYEHALLALRRAIDAGADIRLDLVGDGPDRSHLQFAIDDLELGERVRLLGRRTPDEVAEILRRSDVFLHTSCSEGISNAVLEAMATALPVVTTDAGGMREAVRDGIDGFVVPVRDVGATSAALVELASSPALRAQMGASGRARIEAEFRLDHQVESFIELLREAAGR